MKQWLILCILSIANFCMAQSPQNAASTDSLLSEYLKIFSPEGIEKAKKQYYSIPEHKRKAFVYRSTHFPTSSKAQMISNIDKNYNNVLAANALINTLVPTPYIVRIEFNEADNSSRMESRIHFLKSSSCGRKYWS